LTDRSVTIEVLKRYCANNKIPVLASASRQAMEAAISRFILNEREAKLDPEIGCFGYWGDFDSNCLMCSFKAQCSLVSLGMDAVKYKNMVSKLENPRFNFDDTAAKIPKKKDRGSK